MFSMAVSTRETASTSASLKTWLMSFRSSPTTMAMWCALSSSFAG